MEKWRIPFSLGLLFGSSLVRKGFTQTTDEQINPKNSSSKGGMIAGIVVGVIVLLAIIGGVVTGIILYRKRSQKSKTVSSKERHLPSADTLNRRKISEQVDSKIEMQPKAQPVKPKRYAKKTEKSSVQFYESYEKDVLDYEEPVHAKPISNGRDVQKPSASERFSQLSTDSMYESVSSPKQNNIDGQMYEDYSETNTDEHTYRGLFEKSTQLT